MELEGIISGILVFAALYFMMYMYVKDRKKTWAKNKKRWQEFEEWERKQKDEGSKRD